jgi:multidrug efflux pump subunit AcrA (membrane-fusion protein)
VAADHTLGSIANLSEVWFLGRVFEKDLGRLKVGVGAEVVLNAYPNERFQGKVDYLGQRIDPVARTVTARINLANRNDLLRIGLFGTAYVATGDPKPHEPRLLVPRSAVTDIGQKPVVFVKQSDDAFEMHDVVLGDSALGMVEVISGLREGMFKQLRAELKGVSDVERITARIALRQVRPRELVGLRWALAKSQQLAALLQGLPGIMANAAQLTAYLAFADRWDRAARASQNTTATIAFCQSE